MVPHAKLLSGGDSLGLVYSSKTIIFMPPSSSRSQAVLHEQCGSAPSHFFLAVEELLLQKGCFCLSSCSCSSSYLYPVVEAVARPPSSSYTSYPSSFLSSSAGDARLQIIEAYELCRKNGELEQPKL